MPALADTHVAIAGLGLMGGSLALALRGRVARITGLDRDRQVCALALARGIVDDVSSDLLTVAATCDLLVLATPVNGILRMLDQLAELPPRQPLLHLLDIGSTKHAITSRMEDLPAHIDPIGGHPMCGKEHAGLAYADPAMFCDSVFALSPLRRTGAATLALVTELIAAIGSHPLHLGAYRHDKLVAMTSHLPYLLSVGLTHSAADLADYDPDLWAMAASGFRDTSRLAASEVEMMGDIIATNPGHIRAMLNRYSEALGRLDSALDEPESLRSLLEHARTVRNRRYPPQGDTMIVTGPSPALTGTAVLPGDKSISHRALIHASLSPQPSTIHNLLNAGVTQAMMRVLRELGIRIERQGEAFVVHGGTLRQPAAPLDCGNSGTTIRLMLGLLAGQPGIEATLTGTPGLQRRPMARIVEPLNQMGANIVGDTAPLQLLGGRLHGIEYHSQVASAQVKAALLLAALQASGPTTIHEPGPSRDHSERMLRSLGVDLRSEGNTVTLTPTGAPLPPTNLTIPGDISAAAFLICAATLVPGSHIRIEGVGLNPTRTGLIDVLADMGARIGFHNLRDVGGEPVGDIEVQHAELHGVEVDGERVVRMIDEFPIFAIVASQARGTTRVRDARELRFKESDRIAALATQMRALGIAITEYDDGFELVGPQRLSPGTVNSRGDHRLAMSLAVAGLLVDGETRIENAEAVQESFPGFVLNLQAFGATIRA